MHNKTLELLNYLIDAYERNRGFETMEGKNAIHLSYTNDFFKELFIDWSCFSFKQELVKDLLSLEQKSILTLTRDKIHTNNILRVDLNTDKVNDLYKIVGRTRLEDQLNKLINYLSNLHENGVLEDYINGEIFKLSKTNKLPINVSIEEYENILKCLRKLYSLDTEMMERDFSYDVFGDTKVFHNKYVNKICKIIRDYDFSDDYNLMDNDEIMKSFGIGKNSTYVLLKNKLQFQLNNQIIKLDDLGFEYSLDDKMIKALKLLPSDIHKVITIENLTTFQKYDDKEALIIFLSGFHNHTKQMLLEAIYKEYPNADYYHFGDIDVGGFRIFNHLKESTNIPFKPLKMDIQALRSAIIVKKLTANDKKALQSMLLQTKFVQFKETINYMLENNCKLEQEAFDK